MIAHTDEYIKKWIVYFKWCVVWDVNYISVCKAVLKIGRKKGRQGKYNLRPHHATEPIQ